MWGLHHIETAFQSLHERKMLGSAYLFYGDRGVGKATLAKRIARMIECGNSESESVCIDTEVFVPNEKGTLGVDDIRKVKKFLSTTPLRSTHRIAIIDDIHCATGEAQSALLKVVEEPPSHALLFLIAHDAESLFPPLLSRLQKIHVPRARIEDVISFLVEEKKCSHPIAEKIAMRAFGSIGYAAHIFDTKKEGEETLEDYIENEILEYFLQDRIKNSNLIAQLLKKQSDIKQFNVNPNLQKKAIQHIEFQV